MYTLSSTPLAVTLFIVGDELWLYTAYSPLAVTWRNETDPAMTKYASRRKADAAGGDVVHRRRPSRSSTRQSPMAVTWRIVTVLANGALDVDVVLRRDAVWTPVSGPAATLITYWFVDEFGDRVEGGRDGRERQEAATQTHDVDKVLQDDRGWWHRSAPGATLRSDHSGRFRHEWSVGSKIAHCVDTDGGEVTTDRRQAHPGRTTPCDHPHPKHPALRLAPPDPSHPSGRSHRLAQ